MGMTVDDVTVDGVTVSEVCTFPQVLILQTSAMKLPSMPQEK